MRVSFFFMLAIAGGFRFIEPIKKEQFKGNIAYRTTSERHFYVAKAAKEMGKSISKTLDEIIDAGLEKLHLTVP